MFNISDNSFLYLYDGDLEFERDYYIARWSKSYFPNMGGAFWYNSKRDYENNIVELIDMKSGYLYCASPDEFSEDGEIQTACQEACTTGAITFGDLNDPESEVSQLAKSDRKFTLMPQLNTQPNVMYLATIDPYKDKNLGKKAKNNEH